MSRGLLVRKVLSHSSGGQKFKVKFASLSALKMAVFSLCLHMISSLYIRFQVFSYYEDAIHIGLGSALITSLQLNHLFKDSIFKCNYILKYRELKLQQRNIGVGDSDSAHNRRTHEDNVRKWIQNLNATTLEVIIFLSKEFSMILSNKSPYFDCLFEYVFLYSK